MSLSFLLHSAFHFPSSASYWSSRKTQSGQGEVQIAVSAEYRAESLELKRNSLMNWHRSLVDYSVLYPFLNFQKSKNYAFA